MTAEKKQPNTETELNSLLEVAVNNGDLDEIDRLMATADLALEEEKEEEPKEPSAESERTEEEDSSVTKEQVEEPKEEAAGDKPAASTPEPSKAKPEDEAEALKRELHKLKSDVGRIPFMQSRVRELERELREVKLSRIAASPTGGEDDPEKIKSVEVPGNLKKKIDSLREVDPSLADLLEDLTKSLRSETQDTATKVVTSITETDREQQEQQLVYEQYERLVTEVPWAQEAFKSREWEEWKGTLTPGRLAMATSMYADDVKIALAAFAQDMQAKYGEPPAEPTTQAQEIKEEVELVNQNRARKLSASSSTKAPTPKATVTTDSDALFKELYEQIQKENHIA